MATEMSVKPDGLAPVDEEISTPHILDIDEEMAAREGFTLWLAQLVVTRTLSYFWAIMSIMLLLTVIGGATLKANEDHNAGWNILDDYRAEHWNMVTISRDNAAQVLTRSTEWRQYALNLMIEWKDGSTDSVFTPSTVQHVCNLENMVH